MIKLLKIAVAIVGAGALVGSVLSNALASQPQSFRAPALAHASHSVSGTLTVNGVLRVTKNNSVYGRLYAHGGEQIWKGMLVHSGGITTDSLEATGQIKADSGVISGNLLAGTITGTTSISSTGRISGNGIDAGSGGLTTTGNITTGAGTLTTSGLVSGALIAPDVAGSSSPGQLSLQGSSVTINGSTAITGNASVSGNSTISGNLSAENATLTGLSVNGNVDFSRANITGLNLGGIGTNFSTLAVGASGATAAPLTITENSKTASLGVNSNGSLTTSTDLLVGGNLVVSGTQGIATGVVQAPTNSSGLGALTIQGNGINLVGNTALAGGSDLTMSSIGSNASHIVANGDKDLAGSVSFTVPANTPSSTDKPQSVTFTQPYVTQPIVTVTPLGDPEIGSTAPPKIWVTLTGSAGSYTGFVIHYTPSATTRGTDDTVTLQYQVVGS